MSKKITLFAAVFLMAAPFGTLAQANQTQSTDQKEINQSIKEQNRELREQNQAKKQQLVATRKENMEQKCQNIENKVGEKISKFQGNKNTYVNAFENILQRLNRLTDRLSSKGIDVSKLKADTATLSEMISKAKQEHDSFVAALEQVKSEAPKACGTSKGEFMGKLSGARTRALAAQKARLDIKTFVQTTIKADIMAIRKQISEQKTDDASSDTTSKSTNSVQ